MSEEVLHELPNEFFAEFFTQERCDAQAVLPTADGHGYQVSCTCGRWSASASSVADGVTRARRHTENTSAA